MSKSSIAIIVILSLTVLATTFFWANRPRRVNIEAELPTNFPASGFSHANFEELLQAYVDIDGRVDYGHWSENPDAVLKLESYLAAVAKYSPDNAPNRFPGRNDELAYWMYGYNAYVIKSVLDHWPLQSVTDVKAPLEAVTGLGFFYQLRFSFGGEFFSLLALETRKIRKQFQDPRIHFVLNCASESCPVARPGLPVGDELDILLTEAASDFINDPENVDVDHNEGVVHLSRIFKWYKDDFVNDVRLGGKPVANELLTYVSRYATGDLAADIAKSSDYDVVYREYDWGLNSLTD
jgi:hypothetical protein